MFAGLVRPMQQWSRAARVVAVVFSAAVGLAIAVAIGVREQWFFELSDVRYYVLIAQGDQAHVMKPFAARQLAPLVAGALARLFHWSVYSAFIVQGTLSLLFTLLVSFGLMVRRNAPRWFLAAVILLPLWADLFHHLGLPDAWYAALLAVLLLLLQKEQWMAAACMMFALMMSRESTWLTLVVFLIVAWKPLGRKGRAVAVFASLAAAMVVGHLSRNSLPNNENLPAWLYLPAKAPWNLLRNVLGVDPWSNVNRDLCAVPVWHVSVHIRSIQAIGICRFSPAQPSWILDSALGIFGLLPLLAAMLWWRHRRGQQRSVMMRFALLYGAACYVLAPVLGTDYPHLVGYAWPLFVVALPGLMEEFPLVFATQGTRSAAGLLFCALHLAVIYLKLPEQRAADIALKATMWVLGWIVLRWWMGETNPEPPRIGVAATTVTAAA